MARRRDDEIIGMGCNLEPFSLEQHKGYGKYLKRTRSGLYSMSDAIKESFPNCNKISKDIELARQALERVQVAMHNRLLNTFTDHPDSELLPIYLGRLEESNRNADEE